MQIREIRAAQPQEWDTIWSQCRYATFFHSREWAEIWRKYTAGRLRPDGRIVIFDDGREALLPFSVERKCRNMVSIFHSAPAGTFGGWVSRDDLSSSHTGALIRYLCGLSGLYWRLNPHDPNAANIQASFAETADTFVIKLDGSKDSLLRSWSRGARDAVNQAKRANVKIRRGADLADWRAYFEVYQDSLRRWGARASSRYTRELFELLGSSDSGNVHLWLAEHDDRIIAGAVNFTSRELVNGWHLAVLEATFKLRPVNLLLFQSISEYSEQGFRCFDLGTSGGHENISEFKRRLGSVPTPAPLFIHQSRPTRAILTAQRLKGKLASLISVRAPLDRARETD